VGKVLDITPKINFRRVADKYNHWEIVPKHIRLYFYLKRARREQSFMNVLEYIDKLKASKKVGNRNKKEIKQERELVNSGKETMQKLALSEEEIEDIFDLLERQGSGI